ncbi:MAG: hypothetical protein AAGE85_00670 [Pseudomonadota bacterium]
MDHGRFAFCASTGRTATMFLATTLNSLDGVLGLHEGHEPGDSPQARLPLINLQNGKAWHDTSFAEATVARLRNDATLSAANARLLVDVAFYNAPLLWPLSEQHPDAALFVIFRRCEGFVRSATIVSGEDMQPAGWPGRSKPLTDREKFIALGRLRPKPGSGDDALWADWSAIQRNIWLWHHVNSHLLGILGSLERCHALYFEDLAAAPAKFWNRLLKPLGILSTANLNHCVERSSGKLNQRPSYQIGPIGTWNEWERDLYEQLAHPLEKRLYDRNA